METSKSKELAFAIRTLCSTLSEQANRKILLYAYEISVMDNTPEAMEMYKRSPLAGETGEEVMESSYRHFEESQKNGGKHEATPASQRPILRLVDIKKESTEDKGE